MSGNIFAVQLAAIYQALKATSVLSVLAKETCKFGLVHADDKVRIVLRSPSVMQVVCRRFNIKDGRVRLAFPADPQFLDLVDGTMLEVFSVDSLPITEPQCVVSLDDELSNAVQVELFQLLLKAKGIDIPLL